MAVLFMTVLLIILFTKKNMLYKTGVESHLRKVQGKTYQELGLEFLQKRRWCRKMFPSAIIE